ncbi:MAG: hypothetical protein ACREEM_29440, partial [Blastocatellia bacterium]
MDISPISVPAEESVDGETEPEIMNARQAAIVFFDLGKRQQQVQVLSQLGAAICLVMFPIGTTEQGNLGPQSNGPVKPQELIDFRGHV